MRKWLRDPVAQTAETAETSQTAIRPGVSAVRAVFATPLFAENDPEAWADTIRTGDLGGLSAGRWAKAADVLATLIVSGAACRALELGWHPLELIGVQQKAPHDDPASGGLIFSLRERDVVTDVRRTGCGIDTPAGRILWLRRPVPADGSVTWPWELLHDCVGCAGGFQPWRTAAAP